MFGVIISLECIGSGSSHASKIEAETELLIFGKPCGVDPFNSEYLIGLDNFLRLGDVK
jgi:hypothetical protein